jgi:hypothetical protein
LAISFVVCPINVRAPEPFEAVSLTPTHPSLHFGQAIVSVVVEAAVTAVLRSFSCARTFGEAAMPSPPADLYWALADKGVTDTVTTAKASAEPRTILVMLFAVFISFFQFVFVLARFSRFTV